jgi:hypothetical protein
MSRKLTRSVPLHPSGGDNLAIFSSRIFRSASLRPETGNHPPFGDYFRNQMAASIILQAAGPILTAIGSIVLAIRLEAIIDAILIGTEANQKAILKVLGEGREADELRTSHDQVVRELKRGKVILLWGFSAIALGGIVNALSYFIN